MPQLSWPHPKNPVVKTGVSIGRQPYASTFRDVATSIRPFRLFLDFIRWKRELESDGHECRSQSQDTILHSAINRISPAAPNLVFATFLARSVVRRNTKTEFPFIVLEILFHTVYFHLSLRSNGR